MLPSFLSIFLLTLVWTIFVLCCLSLVTIPAMSTLHLFLSCCVAISMHSNECTSPTHSSTTVNYYRSLILVPRGHYHANKTQQWWCWVRNSIVRPWYVLVMIYSCSFWVSGKLIWRIWIQNTVHTEMGNTCSFCFEWYFLHMQNSLLSTIMTIVHYHQYYYHWIISPCNTVFIVVYTGGSGFGGFTRKRQIFLPPNLHPYPSFISWHPIWLYNIRNSRMQSWISKETIFLSTGMSRTLDS